MLHQIKLENLILLDIETVSELASYNELDEEFQALWDRKAHFFRDDATPEDAYIQRAGLYAEFAKIVCITVAYFRRQDDGQFHLRVKSFHDLDERDILENFKNLLNAHFSSRRYLFSGHNVRDFDLPFICRRMLINGVKLPYKFGVGGLKPWNVSTIDTFQIWKFGDHKNYASLRLLMKVLQIDYPAEHLDGKDINDLYWHENDLQAVKDHCQRDVISVGQLLLYFKGFDLLTPSRVTISDDTDTAQEEEIEEIPKIEAAEEETQLDIAAEDDFKDYTQTDDDEYL